ncbi:Dolichyl-phosphate-mannose--protein mannosyltransferase 4 [Blastocladiella emersonii ATCC 22665]|nr:Dolichyl-phosphate-mannose--protein mannosyltransferase 4 [Blastocladiella emersonii ATCC 22665]
MKSAAGSQPLRQRKSRAASEEDKPLLGKDASSSDLVPADASDDKDAKAASSPSDATDSSTVSFALMMTATVLSFASRFFSLNFPSQVVFDEVHFGKFASYYLRRTFYFDVHPPLGRLLIAGWGYLIGYDGSFDFTNIGDDYIVNKVPHTMLRVWPAFCGAAVVPLAYGIMHELRFSPQACFLAAMLIVLDNSLVAQSRLILLDSMLMLFMMMALYSWVKFSKVRMAAFSCAWWSWLLATGVSLGLVMGVKMVGLFTVATIGIGVLVELWYLLDIKKTPSIVTFAKHFAARAFALIAVPTALYLVWFYIHFAVLTKTGPGDKFMSINFQATLEGNKMNANTSALVYGANVTFRHVDTNAYLHSHLDRYPLEYEDGRISSAGQQITGYPHKDANNIWRVKPADLAQWESVLDPATPHEPVRHGSVVVLEHILTGTHLLTHDVASPTMPTNQEFTTMAGEDKIKRLDETLFRIEIDDAAAVKEGETGETLETLVQFRLVHVKTGVAMMSHKKPLPEWAYKQNEVNGSKKKNERNTLWLAEDVEYPAKPGQAIPQKAGSSGIKRPGFLKKFAELQNAMIAHNAGLTKPHPYQSPPHFWPVVTRGISFWQNNGDKQIYLLPNAPAWWFALACLGIFGSVWLLERLAARRSIEMGDKAGSRQLHYSTGFLFVAWALHYLPFYLMGRSLFLHHYLPAAILAFMVAAGMFDFVAITFLPRMRTASGQYAIGWALSLAIIVGAAATFIWFAPLTYGTVGLSIPELKRRKWLSTWDFQYSG